MARGLKTKEEGNKTYVRCGNGVFVQRMKEKGKDTISRKITKGPNEGKEVHELHFKKIEGQLVDIIKKESKDYGNSFQFVIDTSITPEEPSAAILDVKYSSGYAKNILFKLPNIDLDKDIVLSAYSFTPQGESKERKGIAVYQEGEKVASAYTKDNQNGMPQMKQVTVKGELVWDDTEQMLFVETMLESSIYPKLKNRKETATPAPEGNSVTPTNQEATEAFEGEGNDDLPF